MPKGKMKYAVIGLAVAGSLLLAWKAQESARRRLDRVEDTRQFGKEKMQGLHDGVSDYFEENWPSTHYWYNWWNSSDT